MNEIACTVCDRRLGLTDRSCPNCQRLAVLRERYHVHPVSIGEGGFATVLSAVDLADGRRCAVKVIRYKLSELSRIEREVQAMRSLGAAGLSCVPAIYETDNEDPGLYYIIMEYITGPTLDKLIGEPWPAGQVVQFLEVMLDHLAQIHDAGIIHRDIKPENIKRPAEGAYTLLDFGIAKHITDTQSQRAHTLAYAPPEQLGSGRGRTDPRSDLFSLGVTAYELLTGRQPPSSSDRGQESDPLQPPSVLLGAEVPPSLERTILALVSLHQDDRPPTARAALAMLHEPPRASAATARFPDGRRTTAGSTFHALLDTYGRGRIVALAASPEAPLVAVGTALGIWLYDADTLADRRFIETDGPITTLSLVQGGRALIATWRNTTRRFALDTARGLRISAEHWGEGTAQAISPDGQHILVSRPGGQVLVSLDEPGPPVSLPGADEALQQMSFTAAGDYLIGALRREVLVWEASGGILHKRLGDHPARVSACAVSPRSDLIATAAGATITLYRLADGRRVQELPGFPTRVTALAFSPDGQTLAAAGGPHVWLWPLPGGGQPTRVDPQPGLVVGIGFAQGGQALIIATETGVASWATGERRESRTTGAHMGNLYGLAWSSPQSLVIAGDATRLLSLRDRSLALESSFGAPVGQGGGLAVAPDGETLAVAGAADITLWRAGISTRTIAAQLAQTNALAFTADGVGLVVLEETPVIYPTGGGEPTRTEAVNFAGAIDLAIAADGGVCAALNDAGVRVWQVRDGALLLDMDFAALADLAGGAPQSLALSADGGRLAVAAEERVIVIDLSRGGAVSSITTAAQHITFAPDSSVLATVSGSSISVWRQERNGWAETHHLAGHTDFVSRLAFRADGQLLASVSYDGTLRIWQMREGTP